MAVKAGDGDQDVMAEINITPFTDVLLVLLIIFMIAAGAVMQNNYGLNLPKAAKAGEAQESNIIISITKESQIYVGSRNLEMNDLLPYLKRLKADKNTDRVIIMADGKVKYKQVISVMDLAKNAELTSIALATAPKDGQNVPAPTAP
ncbi:MAG: biopolymer transporter ExbD [Proteobacteria bacterium]|nr:biopolymer transporter ExbD [Pseudomonadota bacterium]